MITEKRRQKNFEFYGKGTLIFAFIGIVCLLFTWKVLGILTLMLLLLSGSLCLMTGVVVPPTETIIKTYDISYSLLFEICYDSVDRYYRSKDSWYFKGDSSKGEIIFRLRSDVDDYKIRLSKCYRNHQYIGEIKIITEIEYRNVYEKMIEIIEDNIKKYKLREEEERKKKELERKRQEVEEAYLRNKEISFIEALKNQNTQMSYVFNLQTKDVRKLQIKWVSRENGKGKLNEINEEYFSLTLNIAKEKLASFYAHAEWEYKVASSLLWDEFHRWLHIYDLAWKVMWMMELSQLKINAVHLKHFEWIKNMLDKILVCLKYNNENINSYKLACL